MEPSDELKTSKFFNCLSPRQKDVLTLLHKIYPGIKRADISQSINRARQSVHAEYVYTITPKQQMYDFQLKRCIMDREAMKLQGIDWEGVPNLAILIVRLV